MIGNMIGGRRYRANRYSWACGSSDDGDLDPIKRVADPDQGNRISEWSTIYDMNLITAF